MFLSWMGSLHGGLHRLLGPEPGRCSRQRPGFFLLFATMTNQETVNEIVGLFEEYEDYFADNPFAGVSNSDAPKILNISDIGRSTFKVSMVFEGEPYEGYSPQQLSIGSTEWSNEFVDGSIVSVLHTPIHFPVCTGEKAAVWIGIQIADEAGHVFFESQLPSSKVIVSGDMPVIPSPLWVPQIRLE